MLVGESGVETISDKGPIKRIFESIFEIYEIYLFFEAYQCYLYLDDVLFHGKRLQIFGIESSFQVMHSENFFYYGLNQIVP